MRLGFSSLLSLTVTVTLALVTGEALAQQSKPAGASSSGGLEEVTVTAQRRTENLQEVPLAVTSFSAEDLRAQQITSTLDIARTVPNFISANNVGQASANVYYIRGLGQTQSFPTFEPQVGTYVDDIYISRQNANNFVLFGVDQLQVLRGPQGTLFGRNSTGGAVVVTLAKPGSKLGGEFEAGYGSYDRYAGRAYIDVPVNDSLRTRFSTFGITDDGYVQNLTTGENMNKVRDWGVREAINFTPAGHSNIEWDFSADLSDNNAANVLNQPNLGGGLYGSGRSSLSGFSENRGALGYFLTGGKGQLGQSVDVRTWGVMSNVKIDFGSGILNIITGYRGLNQLLAVDFPDSALGPAIPFGQTPYGQFALAQGLQSTQATQEFKWTSHYGDRLTYTAGLYYLYETNTNDFGAVANLAILCGIAFPCPPHTTSVPFTLGDQTNTNDTNSVAVYAQGDYKLADQWTLTLGGRFTHENKSVTASPNNLELRNAYDTAAIRAAGWLTSLTANEFTPRAALQYQWNPDLMFFASATRGFQGGGWNGLAFNASDYNNFNPETVWSYELGMRSESSDRKLRLNVTGFYQYVSHYQLLSDNTKTASFVTTNAADMWAYGAEIEFAWRPIDPLTVLLNVGLMDAQYTNPSDGTVAQQDRCQANPVPANPNCGSGIVNAAGNLATPAVTPHANAAAHASYDWLVGGWTVTPNVGVQWTDSQNVGTEGLPQGVQNSYTTFDVGVTAKPNSMPLTFTAECRNCARQDYATTYLFGYRYYNYPGTWDVRVGYKF